MTSAIADPGETRVDKALDWLYRASRITRIIATVNAGIVPRSLYTPIRSTNTHGTYSVTGAKVKALSFAWLPGPD